MASKCGIRATFSSQMLKVGDPNQQAEEKDSGEILGGFLRVMACGQGLVGYTEFVFAFLSLWPQHQKATTTGTDGLFCLRGFRPRQRAEQLSV